MDQEEAPPLAHRPSVDYCSAVRIDRVSPAGRRPNPSTLFVGEVDSQIVVGEDRSSELRLTEVTFKNGARNKLHTHTTDQVLLVTAGEGIVANEHEERRVGPGDLAFIPAGERHWHGAQAGKDMTHWSILRPGKTERVGD